MCVIIPNYIYIYIYTPSLISNVSFGLLVLIMPIGPKQRISGEIELMEATIRKYRMVLRGGLWRLKIEESS